MASPLPALAALLLAQVPAVTAGQAPAVSPTELPAAGGVEATRLQELERALATALRGQQIAEAQRQALQEQLTAVRQELDTIAGELALARQQRLEAARAQAQLNRGLDTAADQLRLLQNELAAGTAADAPAVLEYAAGVLAAANSRAGVAWVAAAQDAIDRSDLYQARQAVGAALFAVSGQAIASY